MCGSAVCRGLSESLSSPPEGDTAWRGASPGTAGVPAWGRLAELTDRAQRGPGRGTNDQVMFQHGIHRTPGSHRERLAPLRGGERVQILSAGSRFIGSLKKYVLTRAGHLPRLLRYGLV